MNNCESCGWEIGPSGFHRCPPEWIVWNHEIERVDDATHVHGWAAGSVVERWAEASPLYAAMELQGDRRVRVKVRAVASDYWDEWEITCSREPVYTAKRAAS